MIIFAKNMKRKSSYKGEFARFVMVGCIAVAIHYIVYCVGLLLFSHNIAYSIGYVVSFLANYLLTTSFTFQTTKTFGNGAGFAICHIINYFMQMGILNLVIYLGCQKMYAPVPVYALCVPTNFFFVRLVMKRVSKDDNNESL